MAPSGNPNPARLCGAPCPLGRGRTGRGPRLRRWQAYTALLMMCRSRLSLSLRPRPKAQVRPRPGEWPALIRRRHKWPDPAVRIGTFPRRVVTARLSVADRVLDQFSADGAEEIIYIAIQRRTEDVDIRGIAWADNKSNEFKKMPQAHDGAGVESARSFLHYGPKQS